MAVGSAPARAALDLGSRLYATQQAEHTPPASPQVTWEIMMPRRFQMPEDGVVKTETLRDFFGSQRAMAPLPSNFLVRSSLSAAPRVLRSSQISKGASGAPSLAARSIAEELEDKARDEAASPKLTRRSVRFSADSKGTVALSSNKRTRERSNSNSDTEGSSSPGDRNKKLPRLPASPDEVGPPPASAPDQPPIAVGQPIVVASEPTAAPAELTATPTEPVFAPEHFRAGSWCGRKLRRAASILKHGSPPLPPSPPLSPPAPATPAARPGASLTWHLNIPQPDGTLKLVCLEWHQGMDLEFLRAGFKCLLGGKPCPDEAMQVQAWLLRLDARLAENGVDGATDELHSI